MADEEINTKDKKSENKKNANFFFAHGRRKEAVANTRLFKGKGEFLVNGIAIEKYFPQKEAKLIWQRPFKLTKTIDSYYAVIKVRGSGKISQLDAVVHANARALIKVNQEFRKTIKKAGLLTRDPRVKERRKYGQAQKARKGKQSPKR